MNELMPFKPDSVRRIRRQMRARRVLRKTKRRMFLNLGKWGIDSPARLFLAVFASLLFLGSFTLAAFSIGLPNPARLVIYSAKQSTKVYDRNGVVLYDIFNDKKRTTIAFDEMPEVIKQATIAVEDKNFYHHNGFDLRGFLRGAVLRPLSGQRAQGGSTITQQFVKNAVLGDSRTLARKAKELILAFELEQIYSKDKILELYLNEIPYGNSAYGVQTASQTYFGKDAKDLTLPEAAVLASLPQAPTRYSPYGINTDRLMARKDFVLEQMREQGFISNQQMRDAQQAEIKFIPRKDSIRAPHFVMYVKEILADKYGEKTLEEGGLKIYTTLDWEKQVAAEEAITSRADFNKKNYNAGNAALVSLDPKTGEILAMVGSKDYFNEEEDGNVNVTIRQRQPGSSIKPIVYAAAFIKGYGPATMLMDVQTSFSRDYTPRNYDGTFRGNLSIREALANSVNVPAVKTLAYAGIKETTDLAQDMGIASLNDPDRYGLSLTLGGGEVTPLELARAYGVFANNGTLAPSMAIMKVVDQRGRTIEENEPERPKRVLDAQVAYLISDILSDDAARARVFGTGGPLTLPGRTVAAKTGTTNEFKDGWTAGYTPDLVTVVWAGNNDNDSMNAASGLVAAPIWNRYMREALKSVPDRPFEVPEGIRRVTVDSISGLLPGSATPATKSEVFSSWGVPTEKDNVHRIARVPKIDPAVLAPDDMPEDQTEEKVFKEFHSERPDSPNWEDPVIAWAKASGYNNYPTETFSGSIEVGGSNEITIVRPSNFETVTGDFEVVAEIDNDVDAERVDFLYDGAIVSQVDSSPYRATIKPTLDGAAHTLTARLIKTDGSPEEYQIYIRAQEPEAPEAE